MAVFRQTSFIGGMLSPSLEGRTDYDKRLAGARLIRNFFVTPYGTLRRRPGVRFLADVYGGINEAAAPGGEDDQARLITFRGRGNVDTLIVLSHLSAAAIRNGNVAETKRVVTPWKGRDLNPDPARGDRPGVKWSQTGNRLLITHPDYEPQYLVEPSEARGEWTLVAGDTLVAAPELSTFTAEYATAEE